MMVAGTPTGQRTLYDDYSTQPRPPAASSDFNIPQRVPDPVPQRTPPPAQVYAPQTTVVPQNPAPSLEEMARSPRTVTSLPSDDDDRSEKDAMFE